jgi:spheroidene monooxygenase
MREYAFGRDGPHQAAVRADRAHPFQHEQAFVRFRPLASAGSWDGRDPVAELIQASPAAA